MNSHTTTIHVTHHFPSPIEKVFDGWLDAAIAGKFLFATDAGTMVRAETDPRVGGTFTFVDRRDGEDVLHTGTYLELNRPNRIKFSFTVPSYSPESVDVTLELSACETGTDATLSQTGTHPEYEQRTINGWKTILTRAATVIGS